MKRRKAICPICTKFSNMTDDEHDCVEFECRGCGRFQILRDCLADLLGLTLIERRNFLLKALMSRGTGALPLICAELPQPVFQPVALGMHGYQAQPEAAIA